MPAVRILFALLLLAPACAWADGDAEVRAFLAACDRAYLAGDATALAGLLAADYQVVAEGRVRDRGTALASLTAADREAPAALDTVVNRVHAARDLAVAVGRIDWTKADRKGTEHFTLVLRREGGQWRAVAEHVSDAAKDADSRGAAPAVTGPCGTHAARKCDDGR